MAPFRVAVRGFFSPQEECSTARGRVKQKRVRARIFFGRAGQGSALGNAPIVERSNNTCVIGTIIYWGFGQKKEAGVIQPLYPNSLEITNHSNLHHTLLLARNLAHQAGYTLHSPIRRHLQNPFPLHGRREQTLEWDTSWRECA